MDNDVSSGMSRSFYDMMTGIFKGKQSLLKFVESGGGCINAKDSRGKTVLMYACQFGDLVTAKILIRHGANLNMKDNLGRTVLMYICMAYGYGYACNYILGNRFVVQAYGRGSIIREYLNNIIESRRVFMVNYLIELGAKVNERDTSDKTVLMYACEYGDEDLVHCLLQAKASIGARDRKGRTPLMHACGHFEGKSVGMVKHLLAHGADVNERDYSGMTPLMYASKFNNTGIIEYLVSRGADIDAKNNDGRTALVCACNSGTLESIKLLVRNKANVNEKDRKGKTVLMHLVDSFYNRKLKAVKYLVENGARINDRDVYGRTALMYACEYRKIEVVQYLLDKGADINVRDVDNGTLLSHTFVHVHPQVLKLLVENNIEMNLQEEPRELKDFLRKEADKEIGLAFSKLEISGGIPKLALRVYYETQGIEVLLNNIYKRVDKLCKVNMEGMIENSELGEFSDKNLLKTIDRVTKFSIKNRILERTQWMLRREVNSMRNLFDGILARGGSTVGADVAKRMSMERIEPNKKMLAVLKKEKDKLQEKNATNIRDLLLCAKNLNRHK